MPVLALVEWVGGTRMRRRQDRTGRREEAGALTGGNHEVAGVPYRPTSPEVTAARKTTASVVSGSSPCARVRLYGFCSI
ncbi:hypothetical protein DAI22_11g229000 [Oryza sativa Japonica Group]|nr:hypothetical protein DAI22_11g229000 [Oryza sativa Japonica Group]